MHSRHIGGPSENQTNYNYKLEVIKNDTGLTNKVSVPLMDKQLGRKSPLKNVSEQRFLNINKSPRILSNHKNPKGIVALDKQPSRRVGEQLINKNISGHFHDVNDSQVRPRKDKQTL